MASINYATREISCKIVYYGPGLSGKTTNLQIIHRKIPDKDKSEMVSLATETDRTLFFDFLPLDLGSIKGFSTKFQLYTVPGQVYYNATRKLVLRGVDGVVFVVDSQVDKLQENLESFANLQENLREYGHSIENIPLVLQYNKRDLPNVYSVEQLNTLLNKLRLPYYEAVAATGVGVFTTLKGIGKSVIDKFNAKYAGFQGTRRPVRPGDATPDAATRPTPVAKTSTPPPQPFSQRPTDSGTRAPLNVQSPNPPLQGGGFVQPSNPFSGNSTFPTSAGFSRPPSSLPPMPFVTPQPAPGLAGIPTTPTFSNPFATSKTTFPNLQPGPTKLPETNPSSIPSFVPPTGGIPVSPFVEGFGSTKAPLSASPVQGGTGFQSPGGNPFPIPSAPPGFGNSRPAPPMGGSTPSFGSPAQTLGGAVPALGGAPGGFGQGNPGSFPGQPGPTSNPFSNPAAPAFGFPPSSGQGFPAGGPPPSGFPMMPNKNQSPFPSLSNPNANASFQDFPSGATPPPPIPPLGPNSVPGRPGNIDTSGIMTTYEELAKDDSFKTKKLPNPTEKKKGFFDGLFKKDK